jgi:hypothetical protein
MQGAELPQRTVALASASLLQLICTALQLLQTPAAPKVRPPLCTPVYPLSWVSLQSDL